MNPRDDEVAAAGRRVSRRWLLRSTAALTAGVATAGHVTLGAAPSIEAVEVPPDHDPSTGEIFDRDRHHRWDTV
jgi:zinc transporter ZupT